MSEVKWKLYKTKCIYFRASARDNKAFNDYCAQAQTSLNL